MIVAALDLQHLSGDRHLIPIRIDPIDGMDPLNLYVFKQISYISAHNGMVYND